jgi:protocatechuate 3,4-dioxygenase beta subunit
MSNRRDLLLGLGAGVGVAAMSAAALRLRSRHQLLYEFGKTGASIESDSGSALRCTAGTLTLQQIEGPFYTPNTPERRDIRDPVVSSGSLVVVGRVLNSQCRPVAGAVLDFWQTDHTGRYDQHSYRYRGHQYTDSAGRFQLVTVPPKAYTALNIFRTPHIHVKVQGANTPLLTTQLYLPDAAETNARDMVYDPSLEIQYSGQDGTAQRAVFDFVLASV